MKHFIDNLKKIDWKSVGHWIIYPFSILIARFVGGFFGSFMSQITAEGWARAGMERSETINAILNVFAILIFGLLASLHIAFNFIPNIKYRYNALFLTAGTYIGVEFNNMYHNIDKYGDFRFMYFVDIIVVSLLCYFIIKGILKEHPQEKEENK